MFFNRYHRIKTEPRIAGRLDEEVRDNKYKVKIKNMRFSCEHEVRDEREGQEAALQIKKFNFLQKLPELEGREDDKREFREKKQMSMQHYRKKDALLNSILEILKPASTSAQPPALKKTNKINHDKEKGSCREFVNQFIQELPQQNTTKHHRAPKIIQNQLLKFNHNNIVRRKIFSEDKDRHKVREEGQNKTNCDLEKIEILTFANKFPYFKKTEQ